MLHTNHDHGAVGLLTLVGGLVVSVIALAVVLDAAAVGVAGARARTAADAAALAAMSASPLVGGDGSPEREAARLAAANGASVAKVDTSGWPLRVTVEVQIALPPLRMGRGGAPLRARATAAVRPVRPMRHMLSILSGQSRGTTTGCHMDRGGDHVRESGDRYDRRTAATLAARPWAGLSAAGARLRSTSCGASTSREPCRAA